MYDILTVSIYLYVYHNTIGAASGANSIYRRTQFTDFGDKRVGEMCMIVVFFTYLTLPHDLLPVNHAEQHNSSLNQTEI